MATQTYAEYLAERLGQTANPNGPQAPEWAGIGPAARRLIKPLRVGAGYVFGGSGGAEQARQENRAVERDIGADYLARLRALGGANDTRTYDAAPDGTLVARPLPTKTTKVDGATGQVTVNGVVQRRDADLSPERRAFNERMSGVVPSGIDAALAETASPSSQAGPEEMPAASQTPMADRAAAQLGEASGEYPSWLGQQAVSNLEGVHGEADPNRRAMTGIDRMKAIGEQYKNLRTSADIRGQQAGQSGVFVGGQQWQPGDKTVTEDSYRETLAKAGSMDSPELRGGLVNRQDGMPALRIASQGQQGIRQGGYAERVAPDGTRYVVGSAEDPAMRDQAARAQYSERFKAMEAGGGLRDLAQANMNSWNQTATQIGDKREMDRRMASINAMPEGPDKQDALNEIQDEAKAKRESKLKDSDRFTGSIGSPDHKAREGRMADYQKRLDQLTKGRVISKREAQHMAKENRILEQNDEKNAIDRLKAENEANDMRMRRDILQENADKTGSDQAKKIATDAANELEYMQFGIADQKTRKEFIAAERTLHMSGGTGTKGQVTKEDKLTLDWWNSDLPPEDRSEVRRMASEYKAGSSGVDAHTALLRAMTFYRISVTRK